MRLPMVFGALLAAGCSAPAPPPELPMSAERRGRADEIVGFLNGEPLMWQAVAEKMLELNRKEAVDQYVRWRLVEDRRAALGISHTGEELRRRAEAIVAQARKRVGEDELKAQFAREGTTEEAYVARLQGAAYLAQRLTFDKIVRYDALVEDRIEIDWIYFSDEADAGKFTASAREKGFDKAADELQGTTKQKFGRVPRQAFSRSRPPARLDPWILDELSKLKPGEMTGVEASRSDLYYVIRLVSLRKGRSAPYPEVRREVLDGILAEPPAEQDYADWLDREMARCRIEYGNVPASREARGKAPP